MESSSFSGSSKRSKAFGASIPQIANCLVDGCNADLSLCRDYHRRHKVCEMHSKTARVTIGGRDQRFCQQCSRFHSLGEFDEGKRSCRKRLDGHNRRRRKPQPDSNIPRNNSALIFSSTQNTGLLSFSTPHAHSIPVNTSSSWSNLIKSEDNKTSFYNNQQQVNRQNEFPQYSAQSYTRANPLQLIQSGNAVLGSRMYNEGFNEVVDCDDRALSLLSSAPQQMVQRKELPESQSLGHNNMQYGGDLGHYNPFAQADKVVVSSMDSRVSDAPALEFSEMFQQGHVGSSASEPHQTLTFMWE